MPYENTIEYNIRHCTFATRILHDSKSWLRFTAVHKIWWWFVFLSIRSINNFHTRIKFTFENSVTIIIINVLDITISFNGLYYITDWYRKPSWPGKLLNFMSYTPLKCKISVINNLIDRNITLSNSKFYNNNFNFNKNKLN